jgi:hypothetical protein
MKYKPVILFISMLGLLVSCASTKDNLNVTESYSLISSSFKLSKASQQKFFDKGMESLNAIKNDANATVNINELNILLDSAKAANQKSVTMINLAGDINSVKYKEKALKYINILNRLYNREFRKYINVIAVQSDDRYEKASRLLLSRQMELNNLDKRFSDAADEVRAKYRLKLDSAQVTE